jgi:predicted nucleic acid-binding protein
MIAVDSSVWINHLRGLGTRKDLLLDQHLQEGSTLAITDVVYMELLKGPASSAEIARIKLRIAQTSILQMAGLEDYEFAAELFRKARMQGHTIRRSTDCMIAAVCIREGMPLLHDDADFDRIADVSELQVA